MFCSMSIGEDLAIRTLERSYAPALFEMVDANRTHLRRWLPWLDFNTKPADSEAFLARSEQQRLDGTALVNGIFQHERLAGVIGFNRLDQPNRSGEIGYWIDQGHEGRGLITRSTAALTAYGFEVLNLNRISIAVALGNQRSQSVPRRLGYQQEGVARDAEWLYDHFVDHVQFSMLAREWSTPAGLQLHIDAASRA